MRGWGGGCWYEGVGWRVLVCEGVGASVAGQHIP